jgi:hypothetical protein
MSTNTTNGSAERRLKDLGISLPRPPTPLGAYAEAVQTGNLLFLSGTLPEVEPVPGGAGSLEESAVDQGMKGGPLATIIDPPDELLAAVFLYNDIKMAPSWWLITMIELEIIL